MHWCGLFGFKSLLTGYVCVAWQVDCCLICYDTVLRWIVLAEFGFVRWFLRSV